MNITDLIIELLQQGNLVELPGMGTFGSEMQPPYHEASTGIYYPSRRTITFSTATTGNDSVIVQALAQRECVGENVARQMWKNYVDALTDKMQHTGSHTFGTLGTLNLGEHGYSFNAAPDAVLSTGDEKPIEGVKTYNHENEEDPFAQFEAAETEEKARAEEAARKEAELKAEEERRKAEERAEQERLEAERKAEEDRRKAEEERRKAEERAEQERLEAERKAEENRRQEEEAREAAAKKEADEKRIAAEAAALAALDSKEAEAKTDEGANEEQKEKDKGKKEKEHKKEHNKEKKVKKEKKEKEEKKKKRFPWWILLLLLLLLLGAAAAYYFLKMRPADKQPEIVPAATSHLNDVPIITDLTYNTDLLEYSQRDIDQNCNQVCTTMTDYIYSFLAYRHYTSAMEPMMERVRQYAQDRLDTLMADRFAVQRLYPFTDYIYSYNEPILRQVFAKHQRCTVQGELLDMRMLDKMLEKLVAELGLEPDAGTPRTEEAQLATAPVARPATTPKTDETPVRVNVEQDSKQGFDIIAGFYLDRGTAARMTARLHELGCDAYIIEKNDMYYVSMGSAKNRTAAEALFKHIKGWYDGDIAIKQW